MYNSKKQQTGSSLIEIMIALVLGIVIIMGATSSLTSMISGSRLQMGNNDMQQTADTALAYIGTRLRNSLSTPCDQLNELKTMKKLKVSPLVGKVAKETVSQTQADIITKLLTGVGIEVEQKEVSIAGNKVKSDVLILASLGDRVAIKEDSGMDTPVVEISNNFPTNDTTNNTLYAITNCESMDVFRGELKGKILTAWNQDLKNPTTFRENYRSVESSMVSRVSVSEIKISSEGSLLNKNYLKSGSTALMGDVELLRILFAVDANGNDGIADSYLSAAEIVKLPADTKSKIISAELFLVVKNGDPDNSAVPESYSLKVPKTDQVGTNFKGDVFADANVDTLTFNDRVMRRLFMRTVTFRNSASL